MKKSGYLLFALTLFGVFILSGCSNKLIEREETRVIKSVITDVEAKAVAYERFAENQVQRPVSMKSGIEALDENASEENKETFYLKESYQEQVNALFYCKFAVYAYESQKNLDYQTFYEAKDLGEEKGTLKISLRKENTILEMEALYETETTCNYVELTVEYNKERGYYDAYSLKEVDVTNGVKTYFGNEYVVYNPDGEEINNLYSAKYQKQNKENYYIFENRSDGSLWADQDSELQSSIKTMKGEKKVQTLLTELETNLEENLKKAREAEARSFEFPYERAISYFESDEGYGHKGHNTNGSQTEILSGIIRYQGITDDMNIEFMRQDGYYTFAGAVPVGDIVTDKQGNDWKLEGYYWDKEYTLLCENNRIPIENQTFIELFAKWMPVN